ncbi:MAG: hypothetical protein ABI451_03535 [Dokdonella sp.]
MIALISLTMLSCASCSRDGTSAPASPPVSDTANTQNTSSGNAAFDSWLAEHKDMNAPGAAPSATPIARPALAQDVMPNRPPANAPADANRQFNPWANAQNTLAGIRFEPVQVVDKKQGGLVAYTLAVPQGWHTSARIDWDYTSANNPTQGHLRAESPDGSAWIEGYPLEVFEWLGGPQNARIGSRQFGQIYYPQITIDQAMRQFVIKKYRGNKKNLQIVGSRPVANLAQKFFHENVPGDSISMRIRYEENGRQVEEDFYAMLSSKLDIPYDGPQGRTWEYHRTLGIVHSLGAVQGQLAGAYPLLGYIASSLKPNPLWQDLRTRVIGDITREWKRQLAAGYAQIAAAGRVSQMISANNDSMIAGMDSARAASNASYAAQRQSASTQATEDFDGYIRGTEKMNDPYWGTSDQSYTSTYHWTDGSGNYQHSDDPSFNPNINANNNWTLMTPAQK